MRLDAGTTASMARNSCTDHLLTHRTAAGQAAIAARLTKIHAPHVEALNKWVDDCRRRFEEPSIPWFDPRGGGSQAKILILLQDPSSTASTGTGFISPDNDDPTANNTCIGCREAGLAMADRVHWNVLPWWAKDPAKPTRSLDQELLRAAPLLDELLGGLLPKVRAVVLLGTAAQASWRLYEQNSGLSSIPPTFEAPHPTPPQFNTRHKPENRTGRALIVEALAAAAHAAQIS
jgi:hypothetical protein